MIAVLIDRSPVILLSGLGAITAVLMVVFKDTLLSLAASIQLTTQELIRVGDWLGVVMSDDHPDDVLVVNQNTESELAKKTLARRLQTR